MYVTIAISTISAIFIFLVILIKPCQKEFILNTDSSSCLVSLKRLQYVLYYINLTIFNLYNYKLNFIVLYIKKEFHLCETPLRLVSAQGFEPRTHALEGRCSIQLSYAPTIVERETRFELATSTLARLRSTTELFPHIFWRPGRGSNPRPPA